MYISPQHFRSMGTGSNLVSLEDGDLSFILSRARALTDAYCAVPTLPTPHDFRGGTVTDETHRWRVGNDVIAGAHRVYLWHRPIKTIDTFRIYATSTQYLEVDSDEMFVNESEGYAEVATLNVTPFGIFGAAVLPIIGLQVPISKTSYTYGWELPVVDEEMYAVDGLLYRAQHQWWTSATATVKRNGTEITTGFTLDRDEGTVTFDESNAAGDRITASYTHKLPGEIAQANAIIAASLIGERELVAKGMNRIEALRVEEVELRRTIPQRAGVMESSIPDEAKSLLDGFVFRTVR